MIKDRLNIILMFAVLFFTAFPYLTFWISPVPESYLQPFCLLSAILVVILNIRYFKKHVSSNDLRIIAFFLFGLIVILLNMFMRNQLQTTLNGGYLAPIIFFIQYFAYKMIIKKLKKIHIIFEISIIIYLFVGLMQIAIDADFLTSLVGGNKTGLYGVDGGRGTISLASEPSYYAFHMIALSSVVALFGRTKFAMLGLIQVLLIAISATGALIMAVAFISWQFYVARLKDKFFSIIAIIVSGCILVTILPAETRLMSLSERLINGDFAYFFMEDESTSIRLAHAILPYFYAASNYFMPLSFFEASWATYLMRLDTTWFADTLENSRIINGIGEILVLYGLFVVPFLYKFIKVILFSKTDIKPDITFYKLCMLLVLCASFSFATPIVALFYALLENNVYKLKNLKSNYD